MMLCSDDENESGASSALFVVLDVEIGGLWEDRPDRSGDACGATSRGGRDGTAADTPSMVSSASLSLMSRASGSEFAASAPIASGSDIARGNERALSMQINGSARKGRSCRGCSLCCCVHTCDASALSAQVSVPAVDARLEALPLINRFSC